MSDTDNRDRGWDIAILPITARDECSFRCTDCNRIGIAAYQYNLGNRVVHKATHLKGGKTRGGGLLNDK